MHENQAIVDLLDKFQDYLQSREAELHLETMRREKEAVKELMRQLSLLDNKGKEFTDLVLYGLLPYAKTKQAKRVSLFPAFMNIRLFFKEYNYTEEDWNLIANKIFNLCKSFQDKPQDISNFIKEFTSDRYSQIAMWIYFSNLILFKRHLPSC